MGVVKEWQSMAEQVGELPDLVIPEQQKAQVRRLICANAQGATHAERVADAVLLMAALGVSPPPRELS